MSAEVTALLAAALLFLLYLLFERVLLDRRLESVPLRIAVTGTRGKSSVVRLLASILRADGRTVLAKTTGSEPRYLLPDGEEVAVRRRGSASIIEQKKLIGKAATLAADCVVAEIMSIHPENHFVEAHRLLRPHIVVLTNVRRDHTEAMGSTEEEAASVLSLGFAPGATIVVLKEESRAVFRARATEMGGELIEVAGGPAGDLSWADFPENLDLAFAVGKQLGIAADVISAGVREAAADVGALRVWDVGSEDASKKCFAVSGFAANDPQSTLRLADRVRELLPSCPDRFTGLLALRADRGDRTLQWIEALRAGEIDCFERLYVVGTHAPAMKRWLPEIHVLRERAPSEMMESVLAEAGDGTVVFGCGNFVGAGQRLVEHWERTGTRYGV